MKKRILILIGAIAICAACAPAVFAADNGAGEEKPAAVMACSSKAAVDLRTTMRKLWEDHVMWTRIYIISSLAGIDDADLVTQRLLRNQDEIGSAIRPFYGDEAATKLAGLLRDHINIAGDLVTAAKKGDSTALSVANTKWYQNADEIAAFLSNANPNWQKKEIEDLLHKHLDLTTQEAMDRINKNWAADIDAYDKGHEHMIMFADALTDGILKQFPDKF